MKIYKNHKFFVMSDENTDIFIQTLKDLDLNPERKEDMDKINKLVTAFTNSYNVGFKWGNFR